MDNKYGTDPLRLFSLLFFLLLVPFARGHAANVPTIVHSFAGDSRTCTITSPQGCVDHPDPGLAVGPNHIAVWDRQGMTIFDKTGGVVQPTVDQSTFWNQAGIAGI